MESNRTRTGVLGEVSFSYLEGVLCAVDTFLDTGIDSLAQAQKKVCRLKEIFKN